MQARLELPMRREEGNEGLHGQTDVKCCNVGAGVVVLCGGHRQTRQGFFICYLTSTLPWAWRYWDKGRPLAGTQGPPDVQCTCPSAAGSPPNSPWTRRLHAPSWTRKSIPTSLSHSPKPYSVLWCCQPSQGLPPPCSTLRLCRYVLPDPALHQTREGWQQSPCGGRGVLLARGTRRQGAAEHPWRQEAQGQDHRRAEVPSP